MPVIRTQFKPQNFEPLRPLWDELAREFRSGSEFGQPLALVETFDRTGLDGYTVVWDKFDPLTETERAEVVARAVETAFGEEAKKRIGFAVGMSTPEAIGSGVLRYEVVALLRPTDAVTWEQCREAMLAVGATSLFNEARPRLVLPNLAEARKYQAELIRRVPGSDAVWGIQKQHDAAHPWWEE